MADGCNLNVMTMKRIVNIFIAALLVSFATSCEKEAKVGKGLVAEWKLVEMTGYEASELPEVYIEFTSADEFVIYQKVGDVARFRKYNGSYTVDRSVVTGVYSDGKKWGADYRASLENGGDVLVMTALVKDKQGNVTGDGEVCKYVKASLPQDEKDAADVATKSDDELVRFL